MQLAWKAYENTALTKQMHRMMEETSCLKEDWIYTIETTGKCARKSDGWHLGLR